MVHIDIPNFTGDIDQNEKTLLNYSVDASVCQVMPSAVVFPKKAADITAVIQWARSESERGETIPISVRCAGTCMSGGSLCSGVVMDVSRYMNAIGSVETDEQGSKTITVQSGALYRDMERITLLSGFEMPVYPASKSIAGVGGMFANNCGGEKSLLCGKAANWITQTKHIFTDGNEYMVKPLTETELEQKITQNDYEGNVYKNLWELIQKNKIEIKKAKPNVSKNSAGYYLWNVWDEKTRMFDLNQLLAGSQGTLGIATEITWRLAPVSPASKMIVVMLPELSHLGDIVNILLPFQPDSIESYDDYSLKLAVKFFPDFIKQLGLWGAAKLGLQFIPELLMMIRGGVPKLIVVAEFTGPDDETIDKRLLPAFDSVKRFSYQTRVPTTDAEEQKYWRIRRESFNLLRKHLSGLRTAPFIDDVCVNPTCLPEFLPKLNALLSEYKLTYTVAGHAGNGNFHIIPLMDFRIPKTADVLLELSDRVYTLVQQYGGSITAEHNDGIIRTPYLHYMFSAKMLKIFESVKKLFDPNSILNPGKKTNATISYLREHIKREI